MIGLREYADEQQSRRGPPEKPLKEWRRKFEAGSLVSTNLMQYFQAASPFFFTIDQTAEYSDLGKYQSTQFYIYILFIYVRFAWNHTAKKNQIYMKFKQIRSCNLRGEKSHGKKFKTMKCDYKTIKNQQ